MTPLEDKVAIVTGTGAPGGIGRATALRLAADGARVVVTDVGTPDHDTALARLVEEIAATGRHAMAVTVDVTDRGQIDACVDQVRDAYGGIDILVNNAGTTVGAVPILDLTSDQWDASYRVNLKGAADFCQAVIPAMIDGGGGVIVNNASTAGLGAEPGFGAYTATKHGIVGLTRTIAAEFGYANIRCNAVCPGYVMTDMHQASNERLAKEAGLGTEEMAARRYAGVALKRAGEPSEIADVIAYLASPAASYITGVALPVSGGTPVGL